ncbi:MAG: HAD hydrolase-like protein [Candidatus Eisenbacteria bacterium]|nr:HAD hydrolase-like protein [Candidatus Eisenbacteria bacterium]
MSAGVAPASGSMPGSWGRSAASTPRTRSAAAPRKRTSTRCSGSRCSACRPRAPRSATRPAGSRAPSASCVPATIFQGSSAGGRSRPTRRSWARQAGRFGARGHPAPAPIPRERSRLWLSLGGVSRIRTWRRCRVRSAGQGCRTIMAERHRIPIITADDLVRKYQAVVFDIHGVLATQEGLLPLARRLRPILDESGTPFFALTNDASRLPESITRWMEREGFPIDPEQIITAGGLLTPYFKAAGLRGRRCAALGPPDSHEYVRRAGGILVEPSTREPVDAVVLCDEGGYPLLETLDEVLTLIARGVDAGRPPRLILPNPDRIYPKGSGRLGAGVGAVADLMESALGARYPRRNDLVFVRLGKPNRPIFEEAARRAGTRDLVLVGDQLATDIRGASDFGIDSVLVTTGVTAAAERIEDWPVHPTYHLEDAAGSG